MLVCKVNLLKDELRFIEASTSIRQYTLCQYNRVYYGTNILLQGLRESRRTCSRSFLLRHKVVQWHNANSLTPAQCPTEVWWRGDNDIIWRDKQLSIPSHARIDEDATEKQIMFYHVWVHNHKICTVHQRFCPLSNRSVFCHKNCTSIVCLQNAWE